MTLTDMVAELDDAEPSKTIAERAAEMGVRRMTTDERNDAHSL